MYNQFWKGGGKREPKRLMRTCGGGGSRAREPKVAHCEGSVSFCLLFFCLALHKLARTHTQPFGGGGEWEAFLSWPSRGSCRSWTCCLGSSAACCWTDCADQHHPARTAQFSQSCFRQSKYLKGLFNFPNGSLASSSWRNIIRNF